MGYDLANLTDLTKVQVNIKLEFDTLDVVLLLTTGGVGYLARAAYRHVSSKPSRSIQLQQDNLYVLIDEAQKRDAGAMFVRVHPDVSIYQPSGGSVEIISGNEHYVDYKISFKS